MDLRNQAGGMKIIANVFKKHKNGKYHGGNFSLINFGNP
jgi:hypothetical protein